MDIASNTLSAQTGSSIRTAPRRQALHPMRAASKEHGRCDAADREDGGLRNLIRVHVVLLHHGGHGQHAHDGLRARARCGAGRPTLARSWPRRPREGAAQRVAAHGERNRDFPRAGGGPARQATAHGGEGDAVSLAQLIRGIPGPWWSGRAHGEPSATALPSRPPRRPS